MQKPITSRVKRSPLLKYSPLKEPDDEKKGNQATKGGSEQGPDKEIETDVLGEKTDFVADKDKREKDPEQWEKTRKGICDGSIKGDKSKVNCDDVVVDKKKETVKGDDIDYEVDLKESNEGTIAEPWQQAKMLSNIKRAGRNVRNAQNKKNKADRKNEKYLKKYDKDGDGELSAEEKSDMPKGFLGFFNKQKGYERNKSRQTENTKELEMFQDDQKNTGLGVKSGGVQGDKYKKADTDVTQGQRTPEQQAAEAKRKAILKAKNDKKAADDKAAKAAKKTSDDEVEQQVADNSGVTTSGSTSGMGSNESKAIDPANFQIDFTPGDYSSILKGNSAVAMTKKGYSMKAKSPAAKKLQGNQGNLPQHLQDSIKAAPGKFVGGGGGSFVTGGGKGVASKVASGFKMKGYGKK